MKYEWKKAEKQFYGPKEQSELVDVPAMKFFTIRGQGNPNSDFFADYIQALYALAYGVRMAPKTGKEPQGYYEYTVYPLEGLWDLSEQGREQYNGTIDKDQLVFTLMIRQPDFVDEKFAMNTIDMIYEKKKIELIKEVRFQTIHDGPSIQRLHVGSYDDEPASFEEMESYAEKIGRKRLSKSHREIYLSDFRKVETSKLRTVLRFQLEG